MLIKRYVLFDITVVLFCLTYFGHDTTGVLQHTPDLTSPDMTGYTFDSMKGA